MTDLNFRKKFRIRTNHFKVVGLDLGSSGQCGGESRLEYQLGAAVDLGNTPPFTHTRGQRVVNRVANRQLSGKGCGCARHHKVVGLDGRTAWSVLTERLGDRRGCTAGDRLNSTGFAVVVEVLTDYQISSKISPRTGNCIANNRYRASHGPLQRKGDRASQCFIASVGSFTGQDRGARNAIGQQVKLSCNGENHLTTDRVSCGVGYDSVRLAGDAAKLRLSTYKLISFNTRSNRRKGTGCCNHHWSQIDRVAKATPSATVGCCDFQGIATKSIFENQLCGAAFAFQGEPVDVERAPSGGGTKIAVDRVGGLVGSIRE